MAKSKPKFRVGQVVIVDRCLLPLRIESIDFQLKGSSEEYRYLGNHVYEWESNLRPLTARERGSRDA